MPCDVAPLWFGRRLAVMLGRARALRALAFFRGGNGSASRIMPTTTPGARALPGGAGVAEGGRLPCRGPKGLGRLPRPCQVQAASGQLATRRLAGLGFRIRWNRSTEQQRGTPCLTCGCLVCRFRCRGLKANCRRKTVSRRGLERRLIQRDFSCGNMANGASLRPTSSATLRFSTVDCRNPQSCRLRGIDE